jgi:hypothetical protein
MWDNNQIIRSDAERFFEKYKAFPNDRDSLKLNGM